MIQQICMSEEGRLHTYLHYHFARIDWLTLQKIQAHFGDIESALIQPQLQWQQSGLLTERQLEHLLNDAELPQKISEAMTWQAQANHFLITLENPAYPPLLKEIIDPPIVLYGMGQLELLKDPQLAIVGSRNCSQYGRKVAEDFAQHLAEVGLTVTSGLASGIDKAAHVGALRASSGEYGVTVAVVATGLDRVYPAANRQLAHQVVENGVMISEYPLGAKPLAYHFPQRNRIISGLSVGTLVVEAALKSGSLITARLAMEQGREVFAVPGSINSVQAKGCHQLIRQGAKLVESGEHILEDLAPLVSLSLDQSKQPQLELSSANDGLLQWIEFEPISLDELVVLSRLPVSSIQGELTILELEGRIEALSAGRYRRLK